MAALLSRFTMLLALSFFAGSSVPALPTEMPAPTTPFPDNSLWRYVHPNSKALVGARWSQIQDSELGLFLQQRWIKGLTLPGAEFLKDVDEVLVSSPGSKTDSEGEHDDPTLLIAIRGNFNLARARLILAAQGARLQTFDSIPIFRLKGKSESDPAFALVSAQVILVGQPQALFSTIERSKFALNAYDADEFSARAQTLASRYECWALAGDNGSIRNFLLSALTGKTLSPDSDGFEAGISVRDGLRIDILMKVHTERAAKLLANSLNRMVRLAGSQKTSDFMNLVPKFRISSYISGDKSSVSLSLRMSHREVAAALHPSSEVLAHRDREQGEAERNIEPVTTPTPKLVIRIEGLDDGPRELPYKP